MHWCQFGCMSDIPILGLMDDFVLYTADIGAVSSPRDEFGAETRGIGATVSCDSGVRSCSVQLLHLRTLLDTHDAFPRFVSHALPQRAAQATSETEGATIAETFATSFATSCVPCFCTSFFYKSSVSMLPQNLVRKPNRIGTHTVRLKFEECHLSQCHIQY